MIAIFKYLKDYYVAESRGNKAFFFFFKIAMGKIR